MSMRKMATMKIILKSVRILRKICYISNHDGRTLQVAPFFIALSHRQAEESKSVWKRN